MRARWFLLGALVVATAACSDFFTWADTDRIMKLRGTVTDASTGDPMDGVLVSLEWTFPDPDGVDRSFHTDAETSATGQYTLDVQMKELNCKTLFLFFASPGYKATRVAPDCKGGRQVLNAELRPD